MDARYRQRRGFTLIEMMVTVAILGIVAALAAPSFVDTIKRQRIKVAASDLQLSLTKARSEAVKRNTNVTIQKSGSSWEGGWSILDPTTGSTVNIENHDAISGVTITSSADSVIFQGSGRIKGDTAPTFTISAPNFTTTGTVSVDLSGRPNSKINTP